MKHILVTGAAGFVGSHVVRHLLDRGKAVTMLDRNQPDIDAEFVRADLSDPSTLGGLNKTFDCIIHLASLPGDTGDPWQMVQVNVSGCVTILEYARKTRAGRFVLASSISAYEWYPGTLFCPPDYLPVDENHPCRPKDIYSTSKRIQELLVLTYYSQYRLPVAILRMTAIIGPRGRGGGRSWGTFAEQLAEGKRVQVPHFTPEETCHYVDARDVARMFTTVSESPAAIGQIFNCCGPSPTTGRQFKDAVQVVAPGIEVDFGFPWSMAQGSALHFDMSKAKRLLGFDPVFSIRDSIESIKAWVDSGGLQQKVEAKVSYQAGVTRTET